MAADKSTFGERLQQARLSAGFHTRVEFVEELSRHGLAYSDEAVGHWERGRSVPERSVLLRVLRVLVEQGGLRQLHEVNSLLALVGAADLTLDEQRDYFPDLVSTVSLPGIPHPDYRHLIGRDDDVENLLQRLIDPSQSSVLAISGLGGIGKTALAYEVILRAVSSGYFEHVVWASAKPEDFIGTGISQRGRQTVNLHSVLMRYADDLELPQLRHLPPDQLKRQMQRIFHAGGYLLVLDNLETTDAAHEIASELNQLVRPSDSARPSKVLLTTRERLVDLPYVNDYFLRGLPEPAATALLRDEASARGADGLHLRDDLVAQVFSTTQGMPLAIKLVITQFLLGIPVEKELARLEGVEKEQEIYTFIYLSIWQKLAIPAQQVLVGVATFGTSAQRLHLMRVSQVDESDIDDAVADLIRFSLMDALYIPKLDQQRYDIHSMTRWFVNSTLADMWRDQS
jgi:hypothetical protein